MDEKSSVKNDSALSKDNALSRIETLKGEIRVLNNKQKAAVVVRNVLFVVVLAGAVTVLTPWHIFGLAALVGFLLPLVEFDRIVSSCRDHVKVREKRCNTLEKASENGANPLN